MERKQAMRHRSVLEYRRYRYLKIAVGLALTAIIVYAIARPDGETHPPAAFGSSWTGYALGILSALLVVWLSWFGVRKRRYTGGSGSLSGWLSAHVYLGAALIILATLHTGFEFGWNVHTLAYVLMLGVIFSGFYGIVIYLLMPSAMTRNLGDETLESLLVVIADLDREAGRVARQLPDAINAAVLEASRNSLVGGGVLTQLSGRQRNCPTVAAVVLLENSGKEFTGDQARLNHKLYSILLRKSSLLDRARGDVRIKALLDLWLAVHVPLSVALLVVLTAHIVSIFFYW
jgi:hypothetical protein